MKTFPEEAALRLYREGLPDTEIAKRLGITSKRVAYWRQKSNLPSQNTNQRMSQLNKAARPLYDNGASDTEIALETGFTEGAVRRWRRQYHLPGNRDEEPDTRPETPEAQCGLSYGQYKAILHDPRIDNPEAVLSRLRAWHKATEQARRQFDSERANWWKNWHPIHWS